MRGFSTQQHFFLGGGGGGDMVCVCGLVVSLDSNILSRVQALYCAALKRHVAVARLCLLHGADPNAQGQCARVRSRGWMSPLYSLVALLDSC